MRTDHQALKWLFSLREPKDRIARWIEVLSAYTFKVDHRPGKKHGNADAMSQQYCPSPYDCVCPLVIDENEQVLPCGPCSKCKHRSEAMMSNYIDAKGDLCGNFGDAEGNLPSKLNILEGKLLTVVGLSGNAKGSSNINTKADISIQQLVTGNKKKTGGRKLGRTGRRRHACPQIRKLELPMFEIKRVMTQSMTHQSAQIKVTTSWTLPYPPNVLRQKQLEDPDITPIIKWKEKEERPFGMEVSASSPATRHYWLYWKTIFLEDGVLY